MKKKDLTISVIIVTKNRPIKLSQALKSVFENKIKANEVIVINEGSSLQKIKRKFPQKSLKFFNLAKTNLSSGRNLAIKKAKSEIIAFTDDDCIVDENWLANIEKSFKKSPQTVAVFGKVNPYLKNKNLKHFCPCTITRKKEKTIKKPSYHVKNIGYGNNMAFKSSIFKKEKNFKTWLGAGSIGMSAEDAEIALRLLLRGYQLKYDPTIKVKHDRWLSKEEQIEQKKYYLGGEAACYGYFAIYGKKFALKVLKNLFKNKFLEFKDIIKAFFSLRINQNLFKKVKNFLVELFFIFKGLSIGLYHAFKDPLKINHAKKA